MAYGDFKDLPRNTAFDKLLHSLASMVYKFLDNKPLGTNGPPGKK